MDDGKGRFTAARTLNEVRDTARFPIIETTPDGNLLVAWIDRRIDGPKPRQLYLMRLSPDGKSLTKNYQVGEGLCECCKLGIAFADGGKTVYMVDREVDGNKIRNHVLRRSTDGARSFGAPVEISNDGWQVPSCPHSGPSIGRDGRGQLHVSWFTLGRSEQEAGIYYSVSKDNGMSFAQRQLVQANTAPETLYATLAVGSNDRVYLAWSNLDGNNKAQIFVRTLAADGRTWSPIQQISRAERQRRPARARANEKSTAGCLDGNRRRGLPRRLEKRDGGPMKNSNSRGLSRSILGTGLYVLFCCALTLILTPAIGRTQHAQHGAQSSAPGIGAPAIAFDLKLVDGNPVGLASFRGKPLMMNFFASWCDPCREEMPLINELAGNAGKDNYAVVGIAVEDTRAAIIQYAQEAE